MSATKSVYVTAEQTISVLGTAHDALRLMVDTYESRKAMASGEDRRVGVALASGSTI